MVDILQKLSNDFRESKERERNDWQICVSKSSKTSKRLGFPPVKSGDSVRIVYSGPHPRKNDEMIG